MRWLIILAVIGLPILDIASLIQVGEWLGVWPTVAMVIASALLGSMLMRHQGFTILMQAQQTLEAGRFPAKEAFDGACVIVGSLLLLFPGFVSDLFGLLLLMPPIRALFRTLIARVFVAQHPVSAAAADPGRASGPIIEGEYHPIPEPSAEACRATGATPSSTPAASPWRKPPPAAVVGSDDPC